jgi:hypothetical protein
MLPCYSALVFRVWHARVSLQRQLGGSEGGVAVLLTVATGVLGGRELRTALYLGGCNGMLLWGCIRLSMHYRSCLALVSTVIRVR